MQCSNLRSYEFHKSVEVIHCGIVVLNWDTTLIRRSMLHPYNACVTRIVDLNCSRLDAFEGPNGNYNLMAILVVEERLASRSRLRQWLSIVLMKTQVLKHLRVHKKSTHI